METIVDPVGTVGTTTLQSNLEVGKSSVNVIFKNVLWKGEPLIASFPA